MSTTTLRPPEPAEVQAWRSRPRREPPRCCHTCDYYRADGTCARYGQTPPPEFTARIGACPAWVEEVPF